MRRPSFVKTFVVGARLAWSRLKSSPVAWLFVGLLIAGGLALGFFGDSASTLSS